MNKFTILRDTREQEGYGYYFEDYPVDVKEVTLTTGDYAVEEPGYYGRNKTYHPPFAVERKAEDDLISSITADRDRFEDEIDRADDWEAPMPVIVESTRKRLENGAYYAKVHPNSVIGTIEKWPTYKNVDFFLSNNLDDGEKRAYEFLNWWASR